MKKCSNIEIYNLIQQIKFIFEKKLIYRQFYSPPNFEEYLNELKRDRKFKKTYKPKKMTFVDLFLQHTQHYESPGAFWKWSAFTTVAAVLRDNCYRRMGDHKIYPNVYTLLLADSAVHRKGHPIKLCEELVKHTKSTKVISGRSSIQGILDELSRGETDKVTGKITAGGSALFSASELSAGIVNDPEAVKILTDIYDFKDEYTSRLRGSGVFRIKSVCFSLIAASNEELLRDIYDGKAIFGGLLGRTFLIRPNEFRPANSLFNVRDQTESFKCLVELLQKIARLKGEFEITEEAQKTYESWYVPFRKSYEHRPDRSGVSGRIHTSVLKLAMVLTVNDTNQLEIGTEQMKAAIRLCMDLLPNYQSLVMASGKSNISEVAALLIEDIWNSPNKLLAKSEFMGRYIHIFDFELCDKCLTTLLQADLVKVTLNGQIEAYTITQKAIEKFNLKVKN